MRSLSSLASVIVMLSLAMLSLYSDDAVLSATENNKILVVATIAPLGAIAREVGGDRVTVKVIVPAGGDPHKFVPGVQHRELTSKCDLFISVGKEPFLRMLGEGGILRISWEEWIKGGVYLDESKNPHYIWLYPPNAKVVAKVICEALSKIDPTNSRYYYKRLRQFNDTIDDLIIWRDDMLEAFNVKSAKVVLAAPHFKPLIEFLGFEIVSVIIGGAEKKAGPGDVERAIRFITSRGADVIVVLITASESDEGRIAKVVSEVTKVPIVYLAGVPLHPNEDYVTFIKNDVIALLTAVKLSREHLHSYSQTGVRGNSPRFELQVYLLLLVLFLVSLVNLYLTSRERE